MTVEAKVERLYNIIIILYAVKRILSRNYIIREVLFLPGKQIETVFFLLVIALGY
jgi:hypothetical protein